MKPLIVANWKMNPGSLAEAKSLFRSVNNNLRDNKDKKIEVVICPPFIYISHLISKDSRIKLGAQDAFWEEKGTFTGEISPSMLVDLGCQYVILGHSERRRYVSETDENINKKIKAVLSSKLNPIFCIDETKEEKEEGKTQKVLSSRIKKGLKGITKKEIKRVILAYDPAWAISRGSVATGNPCSVIEAKKAINLIRKIIAKIYNRKISEKISILYGGSANSQNAAPYIFEAGFQGLLVGGVSLDAKEFVRLIKNIVLY
jgi:triosephosphate isomerase